MKKIFTGIYIILTSVLCLRLSAQTPQNFKIIELEQYIHQYKDWYDLPGVAVGLVRHGKIIYTKGFGVKYLKSNGTVTEKIIFSTASVTKLFVATAVMQLYKENKIHINKPVTKYLSFFKLADALYKNITITHLLNHTSGLPDEEGDEFFSSWKNPEYDDNALKRYVAGLDTKTLIAMPGEKYNYSNIGYEVLGCMIAEVSGVTLEDYINQNILKRIDMKHSNMLLNNIDQELIACPNILDQDLKFKQNEFFPYTRRHAASGTLLSNVKDMCRFAVTILNKGNIDDAGF